MLARVSMDDFQMQIREELSKLDKRFLNFNELECQPRTQEDLSIVLKAELGCDVCPEFFHSPAQLILHQKTHTGQIPSICNHCLKSFALKENLISHKCEPTSVMSHFVNGVARPCNACEKSLCSCAKSRDDVLRSVRSNFSCKVCRKSFTNAKYLKVHMRLHSGNLKPYNCHFCNKNFAYSHVLKMHQVQHYGSRVYQCTLCNITFSTKREMEDHFENHETDETGQMIRPRSTGSLGSLTESSERSGSPMMTARSMIDTMTRAADFNKCSPADLLLPSINSIYSDEHVEARLPKVARTSPKVSVVRHNPVFPITDGLMARLMAEDKAKFGDVPTVKLPSLEAKPSIEQTPTENVSQEEPMDLSKSPESATSSDEKCTSSTTFAKMDRTSLPPIKRRLASIDSSRNSVIQFALKTEN